MIQRTGTANLPLHGGRVPAWLSLRMAALGRVIVEVRRLDRHTKKCNINERRFVSLSYQEPPMTSLPPLDHDEIIRRISLDVADGYDEELEMEIEDRHPLPGVSPGPEGAAEKDYRQDYFRQLFRLQAELVKLQDWVVSSGEKVLILFEGRDASAC